MPLNKSKGDMYKFVSHTFNTVKGECFHHCSYCSIARIAHRFKTNQGAIHFDEKEMSVNLGENNYIFIGSSNDMFAREISSEWIIRTLERAARFNNKYLVQSKNPGRFAEFLRYMDPARFTLCTTIETNYDVPEIMGMAPAPEERSTAMALLPKEYNKMVTIEPIIKFNLKSFSYLILCCGPAQVNIGADSFNTGLPEPTGKEIENLIRVLSPHTEIVKKPNLARLYKE
jgi:DNA repair photolyase